MRMTGSSYVIERRKLTTKTSAKTKRRDETNVTRKYEEWNRAADCIIHFYIN